MTDNSRDSGEWTPSAERVLWIYGYEMIPPQPEQQIMAIRHMLDRENHEAKRTAHSWTARLVTRQQATQVLIVSTSPDLDNAVNQKLQAELTALGSDLVVTIPMPIRSTTEASDE